LRREGPAQLSQGPTSRRVEDQVELTRAFGEVLSGVVNNLLGADLDCTKSVFQEIVSLGFKGFALWGLPWGSYPVSHSPCPPTCSVGVRGA
jgi:hypothetical protein